MDNNWFPTTLLSCQVWKTKMSQNQSGKRKVLFSVYAASQCRFGPSQRRNNTVGVLLPQFLTTFSSGIYGGTVDTKTE